MRSKLPSRPFVNDSGADENSPCVTVKVAAPADVSP
jgi:hypothetical protein